MYGKDDPSIRMTNVPSPLPDPLSLSRKVLRTVIVLNLLMGAFILALLVASLVAEDLVMTALGAPPTGDNVAQIMGLRAIAVLGLLAVPVTHVVLTRLLAIVETVSEGDPLIAENAARLQTIAWSILGLELLNVAVGTVAAAASSTEHPIDIEWSFSLTRWLTVLLLFVLARVFEHGARMREDLLGTI
jgi:hypothetical protein